MYIVQAHHHSFRCFMAPIDVIQLDLVVKLHLKPGKHRLIDEAAAHIGII